VNIQILLATYNSEHFLREQFDSILNQTYTDWELLIRDGGSLDDTLNQVDDFIRMQPKRVRLVQTTSGEKSNALSNFAALLQASSASHVMFCDHDDVWLPNKVVDTVKKMERAEAECGADTPILVYTDLIVVDEKLSGLNTSCFARQHIDPKKTDLRNLLLQNVPTGCTMLLNRALVEKVGEIPSFAVMHDYWVALVATCFGKMVYLDKPTLLYRQHEKNFYGAADYGWEYFLKRYRGGLGSIRRRFFENVNQAEAFLDRYKDDFSIEDRKMLGDFVRIKSAGWIARRKILIKHRIYKHGIRRNVGMFLVI